MRYFSEKFAGSYFPSECSRAADFRRRRDISIYEKMSRNNNIVAKRFENMDIFIRVATTLIFSGRSGQVRYSPCECALSFSDTFARGGFLRRAKISRKVGLRRKEIDTYSGESDFTGRIEEAGSLNRGARWLFLPSLPSPFGSIGDSNRGGGGKTRKSAKRKSSQKNSGFVFAVTGTRYVITDDARVYMTTRTHSTCNAPLSMQLCAPTRLCAKTKAAVANWFE